MKKEYKKPIVELVEQIVEPLMFDTSVVFGGNGDDLEGDAKGANYDDDVLKGWNGWDDWD